MTRAPLPDGPSDAPGQRRLPTENGTHHACETDGSMAHLELPSDAARLHLVLLPVDEVGLKPDQPQD
jgi:hypothetical protein